MSIIKEEIVFCIFIQNITFHKLKNELSINHQFTYLGVIIVQANGMKCVWVDTISLTKNSHMIMQRDVRYSVNKFTQNTYIYASTFLWRALQIKTINHTYGKFSSCLSDESDQDANTTTEHLRISIQLLPKRVLISQLWKIMWDHTDGCANHYCCACNIYLLTCLNL